jgi:hypothetical protein
MIQLSVAGPHISCFMRKTTPKLPPLTSLVRNAVPVRQNVTLPTHALIHFFSAAGVYFSAAFVGNFGGEFTSE